MAEINWKRKDGAEPMETVERAGVPYLRFPALEETGLVIHGFSTRLGGVSRGCYSSMNLSVRRWRKITAEWRPPWGWRRRA